MKIASLEKSLKLIDLLKNNPDGLKLSHISSILGYPASTIHHMLATFMVYNYVYQDPETKKYCLGFEFLRVGKHLLDSLDIRKVANKYLVDLQKESNETTHLYILRGRNITVIDMIPKKDGLLLVSSVGWTTEPHPSAAGKVLLSALKDEQIKAMYQNRELKRYGKNTTTDLAALLREIAEVRQNGFAIDNEEYYDGVRCVAAPVRNGLNGPIDASISVTGSIFTITMERIRDELIDLVRRTADEISGQRMEW